MTGLDLLAERYGIALSYQGPDGQPVAVPDDTKRRILAAFGIDATTDEAVEAALTRETGHEQPVLEAPEGCRSFLPDWLEGGERAWGIFLQLYELRSARDWGIGDFADLAAFCEIAGRAGADFVGTNPLHALFLSEPGRRSPFSPSNRQFLNPLYIAVDRVPGFEAAMVDAAEIARLRETGLVDYDGIADVKLAALRSLYDNWRNRPSQDAFDRFCAQKGEGLRRHALFEALSAHMMAAGYGSGWRGWPEKYWDVTGAAVAEFAEQNADEVAFHSWLQWIAHEQLAGAAAAAREAGMRIGLYLDLAVGEAPDGSASWSYPDLVLSDMMIGAPPDFFATGGQNWGLAPLAPFGLAEADYAPYRDTIAASMEAAGALRIDHAMSLWQLFYVPRDREAAEGAHVRYPIADLLRILCEESHKHRTLVIGEDLGYVPEDFRPAMEAAGILSYRIISFEQRGGAFIDAADYPRLAFACLSTHDLATLKGWWRGDDIVLRLQHGLVDEESTEMHQRDREAERMALLRALNGGGALADEDMAEAEAAAHEPHGELPLSVTVAAHRFIARTPSMLAGVRLADLTGETEPTNLPGTLDSYPNWRPKLSVTLEALAEGPLFRAVTEAVAEERPKRS